MKRVLSNTRLAALLACASAVAMPQVLHAQAAASAFTTGYRYDAERRLVGMIAPDPDGIGSGSINFAAVRNTYDANGRLTMVETGELSSWQGDAVAPSAWPVWNSATQTGFQIFQTVNYTYDADGRRTKETLTGSDGVVKSMTQTSYDGVDRPVCVAARMDPAQWNGQSDACVPQTTGPNGPDRVTKTIYDSAGRVNKIQKALGTAQQQDYVTYTYTASGKIASVTDANQTRAEYVYNVLDRLARWYFPSKTTANLATTNDPIPDYEEYTYDSNGNRLTKRTRDRRNYVFTYTYDALNRNISKLVPDDASWLDPNRTRDVYYGYDNRGLMAYARFDSASGYGIINSFDNVGRLASMNDTLIGAGRMLTYGYDADGNRTSVAYPEAPVATSATYDGLDRADILSWTNSGGTGSFANYDYNSRGLRSSRSYGASATTYSYEPGGRLSTLGQLFAVSADNYSEGFSYNPASQIATHSRSSDAFVYTGYYAVNRGYTVNGLNQYRSAGGDNFQYDDNGNLTVDSNTVTNVTTQYVYDMENRLVYASGPTTMSLYYDPLGRLWATTTSTADKRFLYDGDNLAAEYNGGGDLQKRYFFGPGTDEPLTEDDASFNCGNTRMLHADNQGSIIARSDCGGYLATRLTYDEWGIPASTNPSRFGYTGQMWMPEIGLYYYKARMYSPTLGRFMQTDPIGYKDQVNLYAYVGNDPIDGRDPTGLKCIKGEDKNYSCTIEPTDALSPKQVAAANAAYTSAVNKLMADPNRTRTIGASDGKSAVSVSVTQKAIAQALIVATVRFGGPATGKDRAVTDGNVNSPKGVNITMYDRAINRAESAVAQTFVHEGAHGTTEDSSVVSQWNATGSSTTFNDAHQTPYKRMAEGVIDDIAVGPRD